VERQILKLQTALAQALAAFPVARVMQIIPFLLFVLIALGARRAWRSQPALLRQSQFPARGRLPADGGDLRSRLAGDPRLRQPDSGAQSGLQRCYAGNDRDARRNINAAGELIRKMGADAFQTMQQQNAQFQDWQKQNPARNQAQFAEDMQRKGAQLKTFWIRSTTRPTI